MATTDDPLFAGGALAGIVIVLAPFGGIVIVPPVG